MRYATPRLYLHWNRNDRLAILKMLAYEVWKAEHLRKPDTLAARVSALYPAIVERITGEAGVTYQQVCEQTLAEQGAPITPQKLLQRADKTDRYIEFNDFADRVAGAYRAQVGA